MFQLVLEINKLLVGISFASKARRKQYKATKSPEMTVKMDFPLTSVYEAGNLSFIK